MTTSSFTAEIANKEAVNRRYNENIKNISKYFYRLEESKWCVRKQMSGNQYPPRFPTFPELKEVYGQIVHRLNLKYKESLMRPQMEIDWFKLITNHRRILFHRTIWIGNNNFDLFTASLAFRNQENKKSNLGLVFEIDGSIHNTEPKMKKDLYAEESLNRLNISLYRINKFHKMDARTILGQTRMTDSKERRRIWTKIYLETILTHGTSTEIENLFGVSALELSGVV